MEGNLVETIDQAIHDEDWQSVKRIILEHERNNRLHVGLTNQTELSVLQAAALYQPLIAERLIERGFELDIHSASLLERDLKTYPNSEFDRYVEGYSPLGLAVYRGRNQSIRALLERGDDVNRIQYRAGFYVWENEISKHVQTHWLPIHLAALHGYLEHSKDTIQTLCEYGADLEATNVYGSQAIHLATTHGWLSSIKTLLALGANVEARTQSVDPYINQIVGAPDTPGGPQALLTPLMVAVQEGHQEVVRFLLKEGADIHARTDRECTVLHLAAHPWWGENPAIVKDLLDYGSATKVTNENDETPYDIALNANYAVTAQLLEVGSMHRT